MQSLIITGIIICIITFLISNMSAQLLAGNVVISVILVVFVIILFLNLAAVGRQPVQKTELSFKVRKEKTRVENTIILLYRHII